MQSNAIDSANTSLTFATSGPLDDDIDCIALKNAVARRVRVGVGGTVQVRYPNGDEDTITYASGDMDFLKILKIIQAGTSAEKITVYW